jgi:hypothetical protein
LCIVKLWRALIGINAAMHAALRGWLGNDDKKSPRPIHIQVNRNGLRVRRFRLRHWPK